MLAAFQPRLNIEDIKARPGKKDELDKELDWHRQHDSLVPLKSHMPKVGDKLANLLEAVRRYHEREAAAKSSEVDRDGDEEMQEGGNDVGIAGVFAAEGSGNASDVDSDMEHDWS